MNIIKELKENLDKLVSNYKLINNEYIDFNIQALISNYLNDFYIPNRKIHSFLVTSNYPDVQIIIKENRFDYNFETIRLTRFERIRKLKKLKEISEQ